MALRVERFFSSVMCMFLSIVASIRVWAASRFCCVNRWEFLSLSYRGWCHWSLPAISCLCFVHFAWSEWLLAVCIPSIWGSYCYVCNCSIGQRLGWHCCMFWFWPLLCLGIWCPKQSKCLWLSFCWLGSWSMFFFLCWCNVFGDILKTNVGLLLRCLGSQCTVPVLLLSCICLGGISRVGQILHIVIFSCSVV